MTASPLLIVCNLSDPNDAMEFWIKMFSGVYSKHASFKDKRVKQNAKPKWLSAELQKAIHLRVLLKQNKINNNNNNNNNNQKTPTTTTTTTNNSNNNNNKKLGHHEESKKLRNKVNSQK